MICEITLAFLAFVFRPLPRLRGMNHVVPLIRKPMKAQLRSRMDSESARHPFSKFR
jgi:hypothetical protein